MGVVFVSVGWYLGFVISSVSQLLCKKILLLGDFWDFDAFCQITKYICGRDVHQSFGPVIAGAALCGVLMVVTSIHLDKSLSFH